MPFLHRSRPLLFCLALSLCAKCAWAQPTQESNAAPARQLFDQLNDLSVDPTQIYVLHGVKITRDRVSIYFNRGFVGFLGKVAGEITGAVFAGEGEVLLIPPGPIERGSLLQFTQSPVLEEKFTFAYLRFTDATAGELMGAGRLPNPDDLEQPTGFAERWNQVVHRLNPDFSVPVLQNLLGARDRPYFEAQVQGGELGVFGLTVNERFKESVLVSAARMSHGYLFADTWCSFPSRLSDSHSRMFEAEPYHVRSYQIDTRIDAENNLEGHAELELESSSDADRVLIFQLSSQLRVSEVTDEKKQKVEVFQSRPLDGSGAAAGSDDWIAIALPSAHPVGSRFRLNFTYQGKVIADVGNDVLYVGARGSWYPNSGTRTRTSYDLTFQYPDRLTLVATGNRVEETSSGGWKHSHWITDGGIAVAGFNLGAYDERVRKAGNTVIEVYATPEAEASLEKRHVAAQTPVEITMAPSGHGVIVDPLPKIVPPLAPAALLDEVAENAARAVKYFETLFGPFPFSRLAITQIPGSFGQGWPELVYLPTLSFLPQPERAEMGVTVKTQNLRDQTVVVHEIAHQWWGNEVGWKTQHDQWLSEGFADYAAVLYLTQEKDGERKASELLRSYKHDLMAKTAEGKSIESGGPIWLGQRLSNSLNPDGYENIVYKKACWVIRMLHVLMTDPATGSDQRFFKMLRDFVIAYHNADPSTEDFLRHAGKYMTPALDLDHNQSLDWFFSDWVYGTGIPTYQMRSTTRRLAPNKYVTEGTIEQSEVSPDFQMLVPVVGNFGGEKRATLGLVAVSDSGGRFKFTTSSKPTRVAIDEDKLLAVVHGN